MKTAESEVPAHPLCGCRAQLSASCAARLPLCCLLHQEQLPEQLHEGVCVFFSFFPGSEYTGRKDRKGGMEPVIVKSFSKTLDVCSLRVSLHALYSAGIDKCWPEMATLPTPKLFSPVGKYTRQLSASEEAGGIAVGTKPLLHSQWERSQVASRMKGHQSPRCKDWSSVAVRGSSKCFRAFQKCFRRLTVSTSMLCFFFFLDS